MREYLLELDALSAGYGEAVVLDRLDLRLREGESLALLGRNGAGKSTLLMTLMGLTRLHGGRLSWCGQPMANMKPFARARAGLGWVPQERLPFASLTVEQNLSVVARPGPWNLERVYALFPRLAERRRHAGNQLSGGEQQMLAIGRALMTNPRLLLLDEPMEGLAPLMVRQLQEVLASLIASGLAVILVEQHAHLALSLASRALVLERGRLVFDGPGTELSSDPARLQALLSVA